MWFYLGVVEEVEVEVLTGGWLMMLWFYLGVMEMVEVVPRGCG